MQPYDLFKLIWKTKYNKSGFDLDWKVLVSDDEKKIRLMFQPSMSVKDWFINISGFFAILKLVKFRLFFICSGWKIVFDGCADLIMNEVIKVYEQNPDYSIEVCGHSYGGAMSIIAGLEVFKRIGVKPDIVTFGAPMTLFLFISKWLSRTCFNEVKQYVHKSDLVAYCPPFLGYHHSKVVWLGKFKIKDFFNPVYSHMTYGDKDLYQ